MPGVEDWMTCPLAVVQRLYEENAEDHNAKLKEYFTSRLQDDKTLKKIPSLNDVPPHNLRTNTLIRFRGMVQDMFDPEFYLGAYEVRDLKSGSTSMRSGRFRDVAECGPHEELLLDSSRNVTLDRQTLYCVPIPGENQWAKNLFMEQSGVESSSEPSTSKGPERKKRELEDSSEVLPPGEGSQPSYAAPVATNGSSGAEGDCKKAKTGATAAEVNNTSPDLNFPLPDEKGNACLVKFYETEETLKLNEVVEFVGILSNDPAMVAFPGEDSDEQSSFLDPGSDLMDGVEEQAAHSPPPSLVPRLHAIKYRKLQHNNPTLPADMTGDSASASVDHILAEIETIRDTLLSLLKHLLFGDGLAAEYLLCHLISSVYSRHDVVALGKFSLNLCGCPRGNTIFPRLLYKVIEEFVTTSHFLPMTLESMNRLKFVPKKDYTANRLTSGVLQLSDNTNLVLDEVSLQPGQLDVNGVANMTALGNVISWQKADYDFNFHKQEFPTNIAVLVLSEGKSILKCDCHVTLAPEDVTEDDLESHFRSVLDQHLSLDLLAKIRNYLTTTRLLVYNVPEELQKDIEQDFVDTRKENTDNMSVDDFHGLLIIARLLSLTHGKRSLTKDLWAKAREMETHRKARVAGNSGNT